jgi:hypothetical protein
MRSISPMWSSTRLCSLHDESEADLNGRSAPDPTDPVERKESNSALRARGEFLVGYPQALSRQTDGRADASVQSHRPRSRSLRLRGERGAGRGVAVLPCHDLARLHERSLPLRAANLSVLEPEPKGFKRLGEASATFDGGMSYAHVDGPTTPEFDAEADLFFKAEILLHPAIHLVQEGDAPPQRKVRKRA